MKYLALIFAFSSLANAAPAAYEGYCMIPVVGNAPGKEVSVKKGTQTEIARIGSVIFSVSYGDTLGEKDVLQLTAYDISANKQSVVDVFVENEFPRRVDLVSAQGSISCQRD